jgi:hypothetical protein
MDTVYFLGAAVTAVAALSVRKAKAKMAAPAPAPAAAAGAPAAPAPKKYTCCADGSTDCPCNTSTKARAPPAPELKPRKVRAGGNNVGRDVRGGRPRPLRVTAEGGEAADKPAAAARLARRGLAATPVR